jgi:tetratricopeptide (TPR) repeat protein
VVPDRLLETHLARVLTLAQRERVTGVLTVDEGPVQTRLRIADGRIVFVEAGTVAETLGRVLMRAGKLDREEYLVILEELATPSERQVAERFGDVALRLGMLSPAELDEALATQVREKLVRCLQLDEAMWTFHSGPEGRSTTPYPTPLEPTLLEALRTDPQRHRWAGLLVAKRQRLAHLEHPADQVARRFGASPAELRVLGTVDGRPLGAVLAGRILEPESTGALLAALLLTDELVIGARASELAPQTPPGGAPSPEAPRAVRETAVRRAMHDVAAVARLAHPEPSRAERARDAAARLREEIRRRPSNAEPGPAAPESDRIEGEQAFERGRRLLQQGAIERAREAFERAVQLVPSAADYVLHLSWARYLGEASPSQREALEQVLRADVMEALRQDRKLAFAHYVQGRIFLLEGDERAAEQAFAVAAKLDPHDLETARYVRLLRLRS